MELESECACARTRIRRTTKFKNMEIHKYTLVHGNRTAAEKSKKKRNSKHAYEAGPMATHTAASST